MSRWIVALWGGFLFLGCSQSSARSNSPSIASSVSQTVPARKPAVSLVENRVWQQQSRNDPSGPLESVEESCGQPVSDFVAAARIRYPIEDCETVNYRSDSEELSLISVSFNGGQDCPSGCFSDHSNGYVHGDSIIVGIRGDPGAISVTSRALQVFLESNQLSSTQDYLFTNNHGWCGGSVTLETRSSKLLWVLSYSNTQCLGKPKYPLRDKAAPELHFVLSGEVLVPLSPRAEVDMSNLRISLDKH